MDSRRWVEVLSRLSTFERRAETARLLAAELGADELILLVEDREVEAFLPARGLRQRLPGGRDWKLFMLEVAERGEAASAFVFPGCAEPQGVVGRQVSPALRVLLVGGAPRRAELDECLPFLSLLAAPLGLERTAVAAQTHIGLAREAAEQAQALARELDCARKALQVALHDSQRAIHSRDEFLSIASHELNTPLTGIKLGMANLRRAVETADLSTAKPQLLSRVDALSRQTSRIGKLVSQLLDVTRLRAGKLALELEEVDLTALVGEQVDRLREAATAAGVELSFLPGRRLVGRWDRTRIEQVTTNLLSNAIKYGRARPVHVEVAPGEGRARLRVRDQGIGIAPENLERIFQQFERTVPAGSYEGLGLGLFITRQLVEAHGGTVVAESRLGEGTTFEVQLPLDASHPGAARWLKEGSSRLVDEPARLAARQHRVVAAQGD